MGSLNDFFNRGKKRFVFLKKFYTFFTSVAFCPFSDSSISYSTLSPSFKNVPVGMDVLWTKMSFPSSPDMNPYPFRGLYHFTVPFIFFFPPLDFRSQFSFVIDTY